MKLTSRVRVLVVAAGVAASMLAVGARPALAATEGYTATWDKVYGMQEGISPLACVVGPGSATYWHCDTTSPLVANGADCIQTVYVNVVGKSVQVPLAGCTASLSVPASSWWGTAACTQALTTTGGTCTGAMSETTGVFSFQPVLGSPIIAQTATISDAACSATGGHATVSAAGEFNTTAFSMTGEITWVGSCTDTTTLVWAGQLTVG